MVCVGFSISIPGLNRDGSGPARLTKEGKRNITRRNQGGVNIEEATHPYSWEAPHLRQEQAYPSPGFATSSWTMCAPADGQTGPVSDIPVCLCVHQRYYFIQSLASTPARETYTVDILFSCHSYWQMVSTQAAETGLLSGLLFRQALETSLREV